MRLEAGHRFFHHLGRGEAQEDHLALLGEARKVPHFMRAPGQQRIDESAIAVPHQPEIVTGSSQMARHAGPHEP